LIFNCTNGGRLLEEIVIEERQEMCSTVSKIVKIKLLRRRVDSDIFPLQEGEIAGFDCASSKSSCESKCSYKLLINDY